MATFSGSMFIGKCIVGIIPAEELISHEKLFVGTHWAKADNPSDFTNIPLRPFLLEKNDPISLYLSLIYPFV